MELKHRHFANVDGPQAAPATNALSPTNVAFSAAKATANAASLLIESITARITDMTAKKLTLETQATEEMNRIGNLQAARQGCKRTIGWSNTCLDQNSRDVQGAQTRYNALIEQMARLDKDLATAKADRTQAVADFEKAQRAMAESDPTLQATRANAAASVQIAAAKSVSDVAEGKSKTLIYGGAALAGVIVLAIVLLAVLKRKS